MDMENMLYTTLLETVLFSYTQYSDCMVQMYSWVQKYICCLFRITLMVSKILDLIVVKVQSSLVIGDVRKSIGLFLSHQELSNHVTRMVWRAALSLVMGFHKIETLKRIVIWAHTLKKPYLTKINLETFSQIFVALKCYVIVSIYCLVGFCSYIIYLPCFVMWCTIYDRLLFRIYVIEYIFYNGHWNNINL